MKQVKIQGEKGKWQVTEDFGSFFYAAKVRQGGIPDEQERIFDVSEVTREYN